MTVVRIATRGSDLALTQARAMAARIERELRVATEILPVKTTGDRIQNVSLAKIGGKGLFIKEIEQALLDGRADVAVHSAKDLPGMLAEGLGIVAFPERVDCRDALVARERGATLTALSEGARIGTGSVRRAAQLRAFRPDLEIVPLRGNVPTRLRALDNENLDGVILACAGLDRLGFSDRIDERISPDLLLPAVAQGALAIEARSDDPIGRDVAALSDPQTAACVAAERGFLLRLGGDCTIPLAALAEPTARSTPEQTPNSTPPPTLDRRMRVRALVAALDGSRIARDECAVEFENPEVGGADLGARILEAGGSEILAELSREPAE